MTHEIDCDATPFIPNGWEYRPEDQISSRVRGKHIYDPAKVAHFLAEAQKSGTIVGNNLHGELEGKPVLPANLLDYLIDHPWLIPESWKGKLTFFWGSLYRDSDGGLYVRYLYWNDGHWGWFYDWLVGRFVGSDPAAVSASLSFSPSLGRGSFVL